MRTIRVKYDKTLEDGNDSYYMVNVEDLKEQVRKYVTEIDYRDFYYCSSGFKADCKRRIEDIKGVRKGWASELISLNVVPILP